MKLAFDEYLASSSENDLAPVVLLHGRLYSRKTWKKFAPQIAENTGRKVYALDARNHGESPWSNEMDTEMLTDDLEEFLNDHNISRAILVGHSMGGRTAITLALRKPEKVEKLIVEDMVVENYSPTSKDIILQIINLLRESLTAVPPDADEETAKKLVLDFIKSALPAETIKKASLYDIDTLPIKKDGKGFSWQANLDVLEEMLKNQMNPILSGVYNGEALFLYGNKSFFDVQNDESIKKFFPQAVKLCFEGAGHFIHDDHPQEFLAEVLKFIGY